MEDKRWFEESFTVVEISKELASIDQKLLALLDAHSLSVLIADTKEAIESDEKDLLWKVSGRWEALSEAVKALAEKEGVPYYYELYEPSMMGEFLASIENLTDVTETLQREKAYSCMGFAAGYLHLTLLGKVIQMDIAARKKARGQQDP